MFRIARLTLLLWLPCIAVWSQSSAADADSAYQGAVFKRTGLMVADLERSLTLYRDVLGLTVDEITASSNGESFGYPTFKIPPQARFRFATLSAGSQVRTFALAEVTGIELAQLRIPHATAVVFRVRDMAKTVKQVRALGLELPPSNLDISSSGAQFIEQPLVDFDGHLVVLYQPMPAPGQGG